MADSADVIRILRESLSAPRPDGPPSTERLGEWLEVQVTGRPFLTRDWVPPHWPHYLLGNESQHPGLLLLSEDRRREFMFDLRPARALRPPVVVRSEAVIAGLEGDASRMHDGLWTYGRLKLASNLNSASGTDYSVRIFDHLEEIAVGDDALVDDGLPSVAPRSTRGYRFAVVATNIVRALRYGHDRDAARDEAVKFSALKSTAKFEALMIVYLIAVLDVDADLAQQHLGELARTWASSPWGRTFNDPLHKVMSLKLHGLAALGERVLPGVAEVAVGTRAWNADFVGLINARRATPVDPRPVVDLPGPTASLAVILRARPFSAYAVD